MLRNTRFVFFIRISLLLNLAHLFSFFVLKFNFDITT